MNQLLKRKSKGDMWFDIVNYVMLTIVMLLVLFPLYFVLIASLSDPNLIYSGEVWFFPKGFTLDGYGRIFSDSSIWIGYANSILYASLGTLIGVAVTICAAYPLARKGLAGKSVIMWFLLISMFFSGGLIPTYLLIKDLHMLNTIWALVIPGAGGVFNVIIVRTFFQSTIPDEMWEAASIDGCSNTRFFWSIVLPLSKSVIAVMVLYHVVGFWNGFFDALIYLNDESKYPLQLVLRNILVQNQANSSMMIDVESYAAKMRVTELIKYGVIMVSSLPLLILYPFLQKYFVKGVMIGSIKG
ncbi:carbohydrate ABC transporter permease [Paenibacillus sp. FSL M8-0228]|uniref:Carbohydrate ABC transporter permease n=1 Tax=Paenibacillus polymyxa TaxID=1406 RepID=A0A8I1IR43_PAEPO|nr:MULTISPECIES: carbohydrate ABC transporter permease [Paenibacillus]KAF6568227.1 carbohydrate ABC transporter permease [Paenibacillus sp. EKM206P]KAF6585297.1 carbohydrate ABC transporter permease [Paenibacillus sp. EKM205P]MBM0633991.1 carbohydrate ABC transporter permease [Paenibacillus polymyxa]MBO3287190.1 carbohydrate ABC transporter permease [Paenibacillus polymyxa]MBP1312402.1 putative aldouronate transport system permease protein [Paenibacillus sp. 1182]